MGFTVSSLSNYTVEERGELRRKAIYGAVSMDLFTVVEGIKYSEKLPYFTTAPAMQADTTCATLNESGDGGTFAQITLTVDGIKYEDGWCFKDLETKFTKKFLRSGSKLDENSATELMNTIVDDYFGQVAKIHESAIWQSSKTQGGSNANYKRFNGFIQTLETAGGYINQQTVAGTAYTSITTANVVTIFQNQWLATPADVKRRDDLITVCGDDTFDKLVIALTNLNLYHYTTDSSVPNRELTLPGTNMRIKAVPGLNADNNSALPALFKNRILTFRKDQAIVGTDLINDVDDVMAWYEKKDDKFYMRTRFKLTTGWFFPEQVVSFATV